MYLRRVSIRSIDQELVLRFFAFKNWRNHYEHEVADFLTEYMEAVSDPGTQVDFDYEIEEKIFITTFEILRRSLQGNAFSRLKSNRELADNFLIYHYEAFTLGIQTILDRVSTDDGHALQAIRQVAIDIKADADFLKITTGGGKNYPKPLAERIDFVAKRMAAAFP